MTRFPLLASIILAVSAGSFNAVALSGTYSSNPTTDVNSADSAGLYQEERLRSALLHDAKVIFVNGRDDNRPARDSIESLLARFYVDQFRNSQAPEAPYFTFMTKDANVAMGVGAIIMMRGWFDWNGMIDGASFNTYLIDMPKNPTAKKNLGASVAGTTIFLSILGRHTPIGDYHAYVEGGFNGYNNSGFKLKKAWMQIGDWTAGLATTTFSDPAAQPEVLDGAGANGKMDKSNILVRYMHTWRNRWSVAGSVEFPSSQPVEQAGETEKVRDYVPDVAALGQFQWNRGLSHVRLAGVMRRIAYRDLVEQRNRAAIAWGAQLSTVLRAGRIVSIYGVGAVGQGVASYTGDLCIDRYDLLSTPGRAGRLYAPTTASATAGVKVQILPNLSSTACLATLRTYAKGNLQDDTYKYGQYLAVNLVYNITNRLQIGAEYLAGKRMNYNRQHANVNRAEAVFMASF